MWRTVARILFVFAVWGALLTGAVLARLNPAAAEMAAGLGAGTTLVAWGIGIHLANQRRARSILSTFPMEQERERATV